MQKYYISRNTKKFTSEAFPDINPTSSYRLKILKNLYPGNSVAVGIMCARKTDGETVVFRMGGARA